MAKKIFGSAKSRAYHTKKDQAHQKAYWKHTSSVARDKARQQRAINSSETKKITNFYESPVGMKDYPKSLPVYYVAAVDEDGSETLMPHSSREGFSVEAVPGREGRIIVVFRAGVPLSCAVFYKGNWTMYRNLAKHPDLMPSFARSHLGNLALIIHREKEAQRVKDLYNSLGEF